MLKTTSYTLSKWNIPERSHSQLKSIFGKALFKDFETAEDYFSHESKFRSLMFNVTSLDDLLRGIDTGSVTEFYGQSGSGKTQLCLQLALNCQLTHELGGLDGKVIYISTDKAFPIKRLAQMKSALNSILKETDDLKLLDGIFVYEFNTAQCFKSFVENELSYNISTQSVKLIIIDSIAGIYRTEKNYLERSEQLSEIFKKLYKLTEKHDVAIVVTNHVTANPDDLFISEVPALGNRWSSLVSTRIHVTKMNETFQFNADGQSQPQRIRKMTVDFSPRLPVSSAEFLVTANGIESMTNSKSQGHEN